MQMKPFLEKEKTKQTENDANISVHVVSSPACLSTFQLQNR